MRASLATSYEKLEEALRAHRAFPLHALMAVVAPAGASATLTATGATPATAAGASAIPTATGASPANPAR